MKASLLRAIAALICTVLFLPIACFPSTAAVAGDVSGDEKVNTQDVTAILKYLAGTSSMSVEQGDVNGDGVVNNKDLTRLNKYIAGQEGVELTPIRIQLNVDAVFAFEQNGEEYTLVSCKGDYPNVVIPAKVPVVVGEAGLCSGCGVATLSISYYDLGWQTGLMAYEILVNGADISTMEIQTAPNVTKMYNAANVAELGLTMPEDYQPIE